MFVNDVLDGRIVSCGIVFAFEVVAKQAGEPLPHKSAQPAFQLLDHAKGGSVRLPIDEANEDHAFAHGQTAQLPLEPDLEGVFPGLNHGFPLFGRGDSLEFYLKAVHGQTGICGIGPDFDDPFFEAAVSL